MFSTDGKRPIAGFTTAKNRLAAAIDAKEPWRFHDIRRTVGTKMSEIDVAPHIIGKVMNHSDKSITEKHYIFANMEPQKRKALALWAAELRRIIENRQDEDENIIAFPNGPGEPVSA